MTLLGRTNQAENDPGAAENAYLEAVKLSANKPKPEPYVALGELARQAGNNPDALNWYRQASEIAPDQWALQFNLGLLYEDTLDNEQALAALTQALRLAPPSERAMVQAAIDGLITGGTQPPSPFAP
jgi:tetratricopeptide (TPR) repeat protein